MVYEKKGKKTKGEWGWKKQENKQNKGGEKLEINGNKNPNGGEGKRKQKDGFSLNGN
jgi:hypothetical protein